MFKIAYTGWTWITRREPHYAKADLEASFRECKYLGYDYVENFAFLEEYYGENPQELVDLQKKHGVELVNLYGHFGFDEQAALEVAKKQVKFLAAIGGKWYNCQHIGGGGDDLSGTEKIDVMIRITETLGEYANSLGVTVCFHPHWGTCVFTQEDIDYFAANSDPVKVSFCIDTAHTTLGGMNPAELIKQLGDRVAFIHFKDVDKFALEKATDAWGQIFSFRALGLGCVNFQEVKAALEEIGYDGVICVELDMPQICNYNSAEISRKYLKNALGL